MQLSPGATVERYVVEELVGVGGMARVWRVRHLLLGSLHALKVLTRSSPTQQRRLLMEGRAQAALEHPHLLPVRDVLSVGGQPGLLMPYIDGPSLDQLLREHRPAQQEALGLFAAVCQGLGFAHDRGFVHRDIKPGNVLLQLQADRVQPRLADFGLVKVSEESSRGQFFGTPAYASPEQIADPASVDARADLFSMGVMLAELLAEQPAGLVEELGLACAKQLPQLLKLLDEGASPTSRAV